MASIQEDSGTVRLCAMLSVSEGATVNDIHINLATSDGMAVSSGMYIKLFISLWNFQNQQA